MIFITGPLYSGKRTFAESLGGSMICDVQELVRENTELSELVESLCKYDIVLATEIGGGIVPIDKAEREYRERAGRLACLLSSRADTVVTMFCGIPRVIKGELGEC